MDGSILFKGGGGVQLLKGGGGLPACDWSDYVPKWRIPQSYGGPGACPPGKLWLQMVHSE